MRQPIKSYCPIIKCKKRLLIKLKLNLVIRPLHFDCSKNEFNTFDDDANYLPIATPQTRYLKIMFRGNVVLARIFYFASFHLFFCCSLFFIYFNRTTRSNLL